MQINFNNKTAFYGIRINEGGTEYVYNEGGLEALSKLNNAKQQFKNSRWNLYINNDGYKLEAPNHKSYIGPFTVKRCIKLKNSIEEAPRLIIRMDEKNRIKYQTYIPNKATLLKWYRAIQKSNGLDKMLNILTVLEKRI